MLVADFSDKLEFTLVPVGLLGLTSFPRGVVWSILPAFVGAYCMLSAFLPHYALPAALPLLLMLILGIRAVADTWPGQRRVVETALTLAVASLAVTALPGLKRHAYDQGGFWPVMTAVHTLLPKAVRPPAVVLFPYDPADNFHEEPVYNIDVAWPDDAPIIHAQDLGIERDREIALYYARTQPDRNFYVFDRRHFVVISLGKPKEFLARLESELALGTGLSGGLEPEPARRPSGTDSDASDRP